MTACRACHADIVWGRTVSGRAMPLDAEPSPAGSWALERGEARAATEEDKQLRRPLHVPHWATCSEAAKFRRPRTTREESK